MFNVLLILLICYVQSSQTAVYQQFPDITWNRARDGCKPFGLENRHDYLQKNFIPAKQEFWIGKALYKETTPWIEIIGCFEIWETDDHTFYSAASIGTCKQTCDSKNMRSHFGYRQKQQNNCVCQPNYINQSYRKPITSCVSAVNFFVYQEYTGIIVNMSSDPGNCTTICCGSCNKPTQNRNHLEGRRCSTEDNKIVGRCGKQVSTWGLDYFRSINVCKNNNMLLPNSSYCQGKGENSGQMSWTNVFREEVEIIKKKDFNEDPLRCFSGVFFLVNGKRKLNVSDQRCSKNINWFICKTGTVNPETITQIPLFTLNTSKNIQTHTSLSPSFTSSNHKSSSTGAMIGGILGSCCLLFVSAVLIVCKIRSKGIFKETTQYVKKQSHQTHFLNTICQDSNNTSDRTSAMPLSNQTYELDGASATVYAVVNKLKKQDSTEETYTDAGYGDYDHLHDIQNRRIGQQDNLYHSHGAQRNEEDQTYDSSEFGKGKLNEGIDLYDHSFSVVEGDYMSNENHDSHNRHNANIYDKAS